MSTKQQRHNFLVEVAQRSLRGRKSFDLCRSHLVASSLISKGTIYNHFTSEADLIVSVASADLQEFWQHACTLEQRYADPIERFLAHHCMRLHQVLELQRFVICRVMPNPDLLAQARPELQQQFIEISERYNQWNIEQIKLQGEVAGYDRYALANNFIRGTLINVSDTPPATSVLATYQQFCYALLQLLGHSELRLPSQAQISQWLQQDLPQAIPA
ncbi:TetR/AcrR family transcriptional regulator [uncultured Ferrimonas sp.]|uniref:TetR/AcrR family transcriptional regulator n=1 Tax=uncultured Ferrimonas sp. TaxID=432640 RepID=UPI002614EABA|nr:TetR/AcrR family transcriptional regulator [uncultured Ferrimonas sp.]